MEIESSAFALREREKTQDCVFQSKQDGLFFGLGFLTHILSPDGAFEKPEITAYFQDGDCVFKNQTLLEIRQFQNNSFQKEDLLSAVSYLSGVYTLVSCFVEKQWDFSIIGSSSADFPFSEWERKAIVQAGGFVQPSPEKMCYSKQDLLQSMEKGEKKFILNNLKISAKESKRILQDFPDNEFSLYGLFLPEDLEEFRNCNINSVYPFCLQGSFPCLKMNLIYTDS